MKDFRKYGLLVLLAFTVATFSLLGAGPARQSPPPEQNNVPTTEGYTDGVPVDDGSWGAPARSVSAPKQMPERTPSKELPQPVRPEKKAAPAPSDRDTSDTAAVSPQAPAPSSSGNTRTTRIRIDNADLISNNEDLAPGVQKLIGNVRFLHGNTLMTCDKAEYNRSQNTFFATGNVFVNEGDTLTLRSDQMLYTGDDQLIKAFGHVVLTHKTTTLRTDTLDYDRMREQAYYFCSGTITDDKNTLESQIGVYRVPDDMVDFYLDVHAWDPEYNMYSDTLHYHTETKIITVEGPTNIYSDKNRIYTEQGSYDTQSRVTDGYRNNRVSYGRRMLRSDTLHYDRQRGYARAVSRVEIQDTAQRAAVYGDFAEYFEVQDSIIFPRRPKAVQVLERDTLYSRADTMMVTRRSSLMAYLAARNAAADSSAAQSASFAGEHAVDAEKISEIFGNFSGVKLPDRPIEAPDSTAVPPFPDSLSAEETPDAPAADTLAGMSEKQRRRAEKKRLREEKRAAKAAAWEQRQKEKEKENTAAALVTDTLAVEALPPEQMAPEADSVTVAPAIDTLGIVPSPSNWGSLSPSAEDSLLPPPPDTLAWNRESDDSLRVMRSFHHVRFYKKDLSGVADSVFYDQKTGVMSLYGSPAIFAQESQITADSIYVTRDLEKNVLDSIILVSEAFILSQDSRDPGLYNQIRGKTMRGKIIDNDLRIVNIVGNAQTLYYSYDNSGKSIGLNSSTASTMQVILKDSRVQKVRFNKQPKGVMMAAGKYSPEESQRLPGFVVRSDERPLSPENIWEGPVEIDLGFAAPPATAATAGIATDDEQDNGSWSTGTSPSQDAPPSPATSDANSGKNP